MNINKKDLDIDFIKKWMNENFNPIILSILNRRGINSEKDLFNTFFPFFENIISPFYFKKIIDAYELLDDVIVNKSKIIIFGDRDVDGVSSTVILYDFLKSLNANVSWDVPVSDEPYGISKDKALAWSKEKYALCISVDCGITNIEEIDIMKTYNIKTIVLDHHNPMEKLPDALIINPNCEIGFPAPNFAACGVVFLFILGYYFYKSFYFDKKLGVIYKTDSSFNLIIFKNMLIEKHSEFTESLSDECDYLYFYTETDEEKHLFKSKKAVKKLDGLTKYIKPESLKKFQDITLKTYTSINLEIFAKIKNIETVKEKYLPLVMLGTIADMMSLTDSNRLLVKQGLLYLKKVKHDNLKLLAEALALDITEINGKEIAWNICPVLNAPGRMGTTKLAVDFLLSEKGDKKLLNEIININEERKKKGTTAYNNCFDKINSNKENYSNNLAFFYEENIDAGITGITASKLSKNSNLPIIVAAKQGDCYTGSIRGNTDFHFVDFLNKAENIFLQFGGHKQAAGFRFHENNLEKFKEFLNKNSHLLSSNAADGKISIDAEIPVKYLEYDLYSVISILEPFGVNNPSPVFYTPSIKILNYYKIGKEKQHLKINFMAHNNPFVGLFWNKALWFEKLHRTENHYEVIYELETNRYNNQILLQMNILDMQIEKE